MDPPHGARASVETHLCGAATAPPALCLHPHRCLHAFSSFAHALAARQGCFSGHQAGRGVCSQGCPCTAPLLAARPGPTPAHTCPARVGSCEVHGRVRNSGTGSAPKESWGTAGASGANFAPLTGPASLTRTAPLHAHRGGPVTTRTAVRGRGRHGEHAQGRVAGAKAGEGVAARGRTPVSAEPHPSSIISDAPHTRSAHYL